MLRLVIGASCSMILSFAFSSAQSIPFAKPVDISNGTVSGVTALDVADFNQDGLVDVAVLEGGAHADGRVTFAWFEQKTNGDWNRHNFNNPDLIGFNDNTDFTGSAKSADVTGDGYPDLVFTVDGHTTSPIKVYLFENPGPENVAAAWPFHLIATIDGVHANDMRISHMDRDDKPDVVIRHKQPDDVKVLFQNSKSDWTLKTVLSGISGEGLAVGDLNNDQIADIAFTGFWYKAPSSPRTGLYISYAIDSDYRNINHASKDEIGDLNGDNRPDVIVSPAESFPSYGGKPHDLVWYECPENPEKLTSWKKHVITFNTNDRSFLRLADFNNDGQLDISSARTWNGKFIEIYLNNDGDFSRSFRVVSEKGIYSGAVGDIDNDGDIDLIGEESYSNNYLPQYYRSLLYDK